MSRLGTEQNKMLHADLIIACDETDRGSSYTQLMKKKEAEFSLPKLNFML
jgi:hypothetical protein